MWCMSHATSKVDLTLFINEKCVVNSNSFWLGGEELGILSYYYL